MKHATAVHYADARIAEARAIEQALQSGFFRGHQDCSPTLLDRLRAGLLASPFAPEKVQRRLRGP